GRANCWVDLDHPPNTIPINLSSLKGAPAHPDPPSFPTRRSSDLFKTADFGFTDPNDNPANNFMAVKITTIPAAASGTLTNNGNPVGSGHFRPAGDNPAQKPAFASAEKKNRSPAASLTFQVQDHGR